MDQQNRSAIYGLGTQGRALCSHNGELDNIRFFVGTLSLRNEGVIHELSYDEDTNQISRMLYKPKVGEIWQIQVAPFRNLVALRYNEVTAESSHSEGEAPPESQSINLKTVVEPFTANGSKSNILHLDWHPRNAGKYATVQENGFFLNDLNDGHHKVEKSELTTTELDFGRWNPHLDGSQFCVVSRTDLMGVDTRTMKQSWTLKNAHKLQVRDLDFNPNRQYCFVTCGDDCTVRFWDCRNTKNSLKEIVEHTHWVWKARYNFSHDQLLLTCGSDSRVILHGVESASSNAVCSIQHEEVLSRSNSGSGDDTNADSTNGHDENMEKLKEGVLAKYEDHEDAVYAVEWSAFDPWTFASLSYDGRVVINRVPTQYKYQIFLA